MDAVMMIMMGLSIAALIAVVYIFLIMED